MSPDGEESPGKQGLVMFLSFVMFGLIPKLRKSIMNIVDDRKRLTAPCTAYIFLLGVDFTHGKFDPRFLLACIFTAVAMFTLGAIKVSVKGDIMPHVCNLLLPGQIFSRVLVEKRPVRPRNRRSCCQRGLRHRQSVSLL